MLPVIITLQIVVYYLRSVLAQLKITTQNILHPASPSCVKTSPKTTTHKFKTCKWNLRVQKELGLHVLTCCWERGWLLSSVPRLCSVSFGHSYFWKSINNNCFSRIITFKINSNGLIHHRFIHTIPFKEKTIDCKSKHRVHLSRLGTLPLNIHAYTYKKFGPLTVSNVNVHAF